MTRPKSNTLDPQGVVVKSNLERSLGIKYLKKVSIGRYIEVELEEGPEEDVKKNIQEAIDKLLKYVNGFLQKMKLQEIRFYWIVTCLEVTLIKLWQHFLKN